jgi:hypothetical protein
VSKAPWPLRLWGIRHIRWLWLSYCVHSWAAKWGAMGIGLGFPNEADMKALEKVRRGEM